MQSKNHPYRKKRTMRLESVSGPPLDEKCVLSIFTPAEIEQMRRALTKYSKLRKRIQSEISVDT